MHLASPCRYRCQGVPTRYESVYGRCQSLLPFGHTPTENSCQGSLGEKSQTELECSRCVVLISKFRAFVPLPARADSRRDGSKPWGLRHNAMRRPEDRRILTTGQSE
jgi:hypothetical protein